MNEVSSAVGTDMTGTTTNPQGYLSYGDGTPAIASTALGCTICCLLLPIRSILHKMNPSVAEEENTAYKKVALTFPSDYDKENPLTMQEGQKRLMDLQIEEAQASGNADLVAQLTEQRTMVVSQVASPFAAMQQYTMMSQARAVTY